MKSPLFHFILALCICVIAFISYGYWYAIVGAKSVAVASLGDAVVIKTETANRAASLRASLADIADDEATIQSYFVPETGIVAFIDSLQARGTEQGATVTVLSVSASTATTEPSFVLSLSIDGTFSAVMSTVGAIEYAPYALTVSSLSVTKNKDEWHANLNLIVGSTATQSTNNIP